MLKNLVIKVLVGCLMMSLSLMAELFEPYYIDNGDGTSTYVTNFNISGNYSTIGITGGANVYLNGDVNVTGNVNISGGSLSLDGNTLTVAGNLDHGGGNLHGGILIVNNGTLIVEGDYNLTRGTTYGSELKMLSTSDYIKVYGNFSMNSGLDHSTKLTAGTLEVEGNFTQLGVSTNFNTSGTHRVLLSGTQQQVISFEDPGLTKSHFNILEVTNNTPNNIVFDPATVAIIDELIWDIATIEMVALDITDTDLFLPQNTIINLEAGGAVSISGSELNLAGHDLTVNGDLNITGGTLDLNNGTLTVAGNLNHGGGNLHGGILIVNNGTLIVEGDYNLTRGTTYGSELKMLSTSDYIKVYGNFSMNSGLDHSTKLTAGTLEVEGNFTQLGVSTNFNTSGTHRVLLSGTQQQVISFEDPGLTKSHFNILEIDNASPEGVIFVTAVVVLDSITANSCTVPLVLDDVTYGTLNLDGSCTPLSLLIPDTTKFFANESGVIGERTYNTDLTYIGSITSTDGTTSLVSGTYTIEGDILTLSRTSPSTSILVLTYQGEDAGVLTFDLSIDGGAVSQTYSYETAEARDTSDMDLDAFTDIEEYQAGTDALDASDNSLTVAIMNKTTYFLNTTGTIGDRHYVDDNTYTGNILPTSGEAFAVDGVYVISGKTLTLTRVSPSASTLVFTYLSIDAGVTSFDLSINGGDVTQSYLYDTEQERDDAIPSSGGVSPALIMYLLN